jgi:hypothetical protein
MISCRVFRALGGHVPFASRAMPEREMPRRMTASCPSPRSLRGNLAWCWLVRGRAHPGTQLYLLKSEHTYALEKGLKTHIGAVAIKYRVHGAVSHPNSMILVGCFKPFKGDFIPAQCCVDLCQTVG